MGGPKLRTRPRTAGSGLSSEAHALSEVLRALTPVVEALEASGVRYRIGGSVASSALGVPRSTLDVDLACELRQNCVESFVARFAPAYYIDAAMIVDAIDRKASFNLVHLATMLDAISRLPYSPVR